MTGFEELVERRILAAMARGDFDHLTGAGRPLRFDDDLLVPESMRMACRVLKNAGALPPELQQLAEVNRLIAELTTTDEVSGDSKADAARSRLHALLVTLEASGRPVSASAAWAGYEQSLDHALKRRRMAADIARSSTPTTGDST
jgi:Domain of unknown function (DUF1992)